LALEAPGRRLDRGSGSLQKPLVSVVITAFNCAEFLTAAIDSVLAQTYRDYEIVIVNDGSTDDTDDVVQPYLKDQRLSYYKKKNGGASSSRNLGIQNSRGDFVAFLDGDDLWEQRKLAEQMAVFERDPRVGVVFSHIRMISTTGKPIPYENPRCYRGFVLPHLYAYNFVPLSSSIVRRRLFDKCGMFDESLNMGMDYDLWLRLSLLTEFDYVPEVLIGYRVGQRQLSANTKAREFWGTFVQKRFRDRYPSRVTPEMIRNAQFTAALTQFRRREASDRRAALSALIRMCTCRPLSPTTYKSIGRFVLINLAGVVRKARARNGAGQEGNPSAVAAKKTV